MRPLAFALPLLAALPAHAQERSLWELIHPDRIVARALAGAVIGLRSQMDLTYSDMTVSVAQGRVQVDDLRLILYDNITGGDVCELAMDMVEIRLGDPFAATRFDVSAALRGIVAQPDCLQAEGRAVLWMLDQQSLTLPEATVELSYDLPSGGADLSVAATASGVAAVTLEAAFDYVTAWQGDAPSGAEPDLIGELSRASIVAEDLGGWPYLREILPADLTDPDGAAEAVGQLLEEMLGGPGPDGAPAPKAVRAFIAEAARGWGAFIADPARIVLETNLSPGAPAILDAEVFEGGPAALLEALQPVVRTAPAREAAGLSRELLLRATEAPETLSRDERRAAGLAFLTGTGAPRARALGVELLSALAGSGDGEVATAVARALADSDPETAYAAALEAGGTGEAGLRGLLDRIEGDLPFATRLRLQGGASSALPLDEVAGATVAELRTRAQAHLSGVAAPRSLRHALFFALLAAARGDMAAERIVARIEDRVPVDDAGLWPPLVAEVEAAVLTAWLAQAR